MSTATKPKTMLVRIHRPDKRLGYIAETLTLSNSGYPKFDYRRGWYEVDLATARKLKRLLNNPMDQTSKPVFEICSPTEAKALDIAEKQQVAAATAPVPLPKKVHQPTRAELAAAEKSADEADEDADLNDDLNDEDWTDDMAPEGDEDSPEVQETADEDDLDDLDDLVDPETAPKPVAKKVAKKRVAKKVAKKTTKKTRGK